MACEGKKKAVIHLKKNGKKFTIVCNNPPVFISCKNLNYQDCRLTKVSYSYEQFIHSTLPNSIRDGTANFYTPILGIQVLNKQAIQIKSANFSNGICTIPVWNTVKTISAPDFLDATIISMIDVDTRPRDNANTSAKGVLIKDVTGYIIYDDNQTNCDWTISCDDDDDCPPGSHKCTHNKYPGYCCVPCKETGDRLKNIANKVGR